MPVDPELWKIVEDQFPMGKNSHHGIKHWRRVLRFGEKLARMTGADLEILELFALFHDARRVNDAVDPGHGARGADLASQYHDRHFLLNDERLEVLLKACREHTMGSLTDHATIGTCWDADRLDLWRVGIYPRAKYMCTAEAKKKEVIEWAVRHSALA